MNWAAEIQPLTAVCAGAMVRARFNPPSAGWPINFVLQPWQLYLAILAGWVNRQQQEVIDYLRTENQVLKEQLGSKRVLLNNDQRRRLGVKGKILGRRRLQGSLAAHQPVAQSRHS